LKPFRPLAARLVLAAIALVSPTLLLPACAPQAEEPAPAATEPTPGDSDIRAAVAATMQEYTEAIGRGDYEAALQFYADDPRFHWVEDGVLTYASRDDVARAFDGLASLGQVTVEYTPPRVEIVSPDTALLYTTHATTVGSGERAFRFTGAITITLIRQGDRWVFLAGHSSTPRTLGQ
jgi:uncharacterized protein (TIGR02246 family)